MKRDYIFFLALGFLLLVTESALGDMASFYGVRIDGVYALLVWFGVRVPMPEGLTPVLLLGVMAEGLTALHPGLYIGAYALAYLMVRYVVRHLMYTSMLHRILLVLFVSMNGTVIILAGGGRAELVWPWGVMQTVLNGLCAPFFLIFFNWLYDAIISQDEYPDSGASNAHFRHKGNS